MRDLHRVAAIVVVYVSEGVEIAFCNARAPSGLRGLICWRAYLADWLAKQMNAGPDKVDAAQSVWRGSARRLHLVKLMGLSEVQLALGLCRRLDWIKRASTSRYGTLVCIRPDVVSTPAPSRDSRGARQLRGPPN